MRFNRRGGMASLLLLCTSTSTYKLLYSWDGLLLVINLLAFYEFTRFVAWRQPGDTIKLLLSYWRRFDDYFKKKSIEG